MAGKGHGSFSFVLVSILGCHPNGLVGAMFGNFLFVNGTKKPFLVDVPSPFKAFSGNKRETALYLGAFRAGF